MVQQVVNFAQNIADILFQKWNLKTDLGKKNIDFAGFSYSPDTRFLQGRNTVIEITNPSGDAIPSSLAYTPIDEAFKLDVWMKISDASKEAREREENNRALIKDQILDIMHKNQTAISGLNITMFDRFQNSDDLDGTQIILHSVIWLIGEWIHRK